MWDNGFYFMIFFCVLGGVWVYYIVVWCILGVLGKKFEWLWGFCLVRFKLYFIGFGVINGVFICFENVYILFCFEYLIVRRM